MIAANFNYLSIEESNILINGVKNTRDKCIVLIMLDAGLRVSETISLKFQDFNFKRKEIVINSLKKRGKNHYRIVPISNRLYRAIAEYLKKIKNIVADAFLFPSPHFSDRPITRQAVWKILKQVKDKKNISANLHPHALRHTFATHHLAGGSSLEEIKTMLGHSSYNTTLVYAEIPQETLRDRVNQITEPQFSFIKRIFYKIRPPKAIKNINISFQNKLFTIGRTSEIEQLESLVNRGINTLILGDIGTGKSHLLNTLKIDKKIIRLDDSDGIKKSLAWILLKLYGDNKAVLQLLWKDFHKNEITTKIQRESIPALCTLIKESVEPNEYCLLIDDISKITPAGRKAIEKLKDVFVIVCSARFIKSNDSSFVWNFEKLKLENLNRTNSFELINRLGSSLEVEDFSVARQHIFDQSQGNPRAISELIDRFYKEPFLTTDLVRSIKHTGSLGEIDLSFIIVLFLGCIMAMRYIASEMGQPGLKFFGAVAMIMLLMYRPFMAKFKRNYL
jgi:hypothetical protein